MENKPKESKHKLWEYSKVFFRFAHFLLTLFVFAALFISTITTFLDPASQIDPFSTIFALIVVTSLMEAGVHRFWPRLYYRIGIPVLIKKYSIDFVENLPSDFGNISGSVKANGMLPQVVFKQLSRFEYGLWANKTAGNQGRLARKSRYNPVTRGYICLDIENMKLKIQVYLNWTTIPFFLWFGIVILEPGLIIKPIIVVLGIMIFIQLFRGEIQQYMKAWDVVIRYTYGEIGIEDIAVELAKT